MSPDYWQRRLRRLGLTLTIYEREVTNDWTVFVEPIDPSRSDIRFRPLMGIGVHVSRDEAIRIAVVDFEFAEAEQLREKVVLGLAGEGRA